jgi:small ligand-binding sensory domain FIST
MSFAAALSQHPIPADAAGEVLGEVLEKVGQLPDLAVVFVTGPMVGALEDIACTVEAVLGPAALIGAAASSVVGGDREVEEESAVTLWAGHFGQEVRPVRLEAVPTGEGWRIDGLTSPEPLHGTLLLLSDPFSFPADGLLDQLAIDAPGLTVIGGLASAGRGPGGNRLVLGDRVHTEGAVGALLPPGPVVTPLVSQGCRPLGQPWVVTRAERNVIYELAGVPALERLTELIEGASPADRALLARGLHLGVVIDEHRVEFERGDFLVRNVLGADRSIGAIAVGDVVELGSIVQFHVRDADTADEDLRMLLAESGPADAALVFTCNGRGTHLFDEPDHDAKLIAGLAGSATAGMFCAGEIGPVGRRSFLHGFTASVALFRR